MKRFGLVLIVSLALSANAATAALVHLHADAGHHSDHHDGRQVHRHALAHATATHADHHDSPADQEPSDTETSVDVDQAFLFLVPAVISSNSVPGGTGVLVAPPPPLLPPTTERGATPPIWPPPHLADSFDVDPLAPRGPPR